MEVLIVLAALVLVLMLIVSRARTLKAKALVSERIASLLEKSVYPMPTLETVSESQSLIITRNANGWTIKHSDLIYVYEDDPTLDDSEVVSLHNALWEIVEYFADYAGDRDSVHIYVSVEPSYADS